MPTPIHFLTAAELAAKIRAGELTARQVVTDFFAHIKRHNLAYNAVVTLNEAAALQQAEKADRAQANGEQPGPLHGVPITIKDTYRVKGLRATAGYLPLKDYIAEDDAVVVKLLREAGAIILGKTNTTTLAMDMQTFNPIFGVTHNPWDVTRTPAGSSGGCATALATGMTALSIGSDLAGSIRLPAGYCGVYGLKPTHGVASMEGRSAGASPGGWSAGAAASVPATVPEQPARAARRSVRSSWAWRMRWTIHERAPARRAPVVCAAPEATNRWARWTRGCAW